MLRMLVALILTALSTSTLQSTRRPFELVIAIHSNSKCSVVSVRRTQHHKGLSINKSGPYIVERSSKHVHGLDEHIRVFAYDRDVLWTQAHSICDEVLWDKSVSFVPTENPSEPQQNVLSSQPVDDVGWQANVPPLHIRSEERRVGKECRS